MVSSTAARVTFSIGSRSNPRIISGEMTPYALPLRIRKAAEFFLIEDASGVAPSRPPMSISRMILVGDGSSIGFPAPTPRRSRHPFRELNTASETFDIQFARRALRKSTLALRGFAGSIDKQPRQAS